MLMHALQRWLFTKLLWEEWSILSLLTETADYSSVRINPKNLKNLCLISSILFKCYLILH